MSRPGDERREIPREDAAAALAARQELGAEYEPAVVDSFVDRLDKAIDARVAEQLHGRVPAARAASEPPPVNKTAFALAIVSLGTGIPITAIAAALTGLPGLLIVWTGIVMINIAYGMSQRRL